MYVLHITMLWEHLGNLGNTKGTKVLCYVFTLSNLSILSILHTLHIPPSFSHLPKFSTRPLLFHTLPKFPTLSKMFFICHCFYFSSIYIIFFSQPRTTSNTPNYLKTVTQVLEHYDTSFYTSYTNCTVLRNLYSMYILSLNVYLI